MTAGSPRDPYDANQYIPGQPSRMPAWIWERAPYLGRALGTLRAPDLAFGPAELDLMAPPIPRNGVWAGGPAVSAQSPGTPAIYPVAQVGQLTMPTAAQAVGDAVPGVFFLAPQIGG